jgi:3-hydroxyisobutyrate dehydrogenase-like beta-hydroxyacid dehydrogenase
MTKGGCVSAVGFIGAGQMGRPMVKRLLGAGHDVVLYARKAEVREALGAAGARLVETPRAVAEASDVVVACLFSDPQMLAVSEGNDGIIAGLRPGSLLASHVTGSARTIHRLAEAARDRQAQVIDAPVSGTAEDIANGRLTVLVGGDANLVAVCTEVFGAYADTVVHTGATGSALAVKLINNMLFAAQCQLAAEAARLGRELGVDRRLLLSAIKSCSGDSYALRCLSLFENDAEFARVTGPFLQKDIRAGEVELASTGVAGDFLLDIAGHGALPLR